MKLIVAGPIIITAINNFIGKNRKQIVPLFGYIAIL
jgi:hypothetical protein